MSLSGLSVTLVAVAISWGFSAGRVWKMDAEALKSVPDGKLCYAVALAIDSKRSFPAGNSEADRRELTCQAEKEEVISNCASLMIVDNNNVPLYVGDGFSARYTVRSLSDKPTNFRLTFASSITTLQTVPAGGTVSVQLDISPASSGMVWNGQQWSRRASAQLQDCRVVRGFGTRAPSEIPWD